MPTFKGTMKFNHTTANGNVSGWSESFYLSGAYTLEQALTEINTLGYYRVQLLTARTRLVSIQVADISKTGVSLVRPGGRHGTLPTTGADTPWQSLIFELRSSTGSRRSFTMRGLPDNQIAEGDYLPSIFYRNAVSAFGNELIRRPYLIRGVDRANVPVEIASIDNLGNVVTVSDLALTLNDRVQFYRAVAADSRPIKGVRFLETVTDARHFKVKNWDDSYSFWSGKIRKFGFAFDPITFQNQNRVSLHKTGAPFFQSVGRRSPTR